MCYRTAQVTVTEDISGKWADKLTKPVACTIFFIFLDFYKIHNAGIQKKDHINNTVFDAIAGNA